MPHAILSELPSGTSVVFSLVQSIPQLDEPLRTQVKQEFAEAMQIFWRVLIGIGALGFISSLLMKALPLHTALDEDFALEKNGEDSTEVFIEIQGIGPHDDANGKVV